MMKYFFNMLLFSILISEAAYAQGIFNQDKTRRKRSLKQIVLLKAYSAYLQKGYQIMSKGIYTIHEIKEGEFNLHLGYFSSLKTVKPEIKKYSRVKDIMQLAEKIEESSDNILNGRIEALTIKEQQYVNEAIRRILNESQMDIQELEMIISDGRLSLSDAERINEIDRIYSRISHHYLALQHVKENMILLIEGRTAGLDEAKALRKWYGIH